MTKVFDKVSLFPVKNYPKGAVIFKEGDSGTSAFLVQSGKVEVSKQGTDGKLVLDIIESPEIFGEMSFLNNAPRSATVTTLEPCCVVEIKHDKLDELLEQCPIVVKALVRCLSRRLKATSTILQLQKSESVFMGVCSALAVFEPKRSVLLPKVGRVHAYDVEPTVREISKALDVSYDIAYATISTLRDLDVLEIGLKPSGVGHEMRIIQPESFLQRAQETHKKIEKKESKRLAKLHNYVSLATLSEELSLDSLEIRKWLASESLPDAVFYFDKEALTSWLRSSCE